MTHNQALIRPLDGDRQINKCFGDTHTCAQWHVNGGNIDAEKKQKTIVRSESSHVINGLFVPEKSAIFFFFLIGQIIHIIL